MGLSTAAQRNTPLVRDGARGQIMHNTAGSLRPIVSASRIAVRHSKLLNSTRAISGCRAISIFTSGADERSESGKRVDRYLHRSPPLTC